jgi:RHS repeat-associated protein
MFTSYERDSESGNDYARARNYVSRLGRLSSPDLLGGARRDPQSLNRYTYVDNDPANSSDPLGLSPGQLTDCLIDGVKSFECQYIFRLFERGGALQCPDNNCGPFTGANGNLYFAALTSEGWAYVNPLSGDLFSDGSELGLPSLDDTPVNIPNPPNDPIGDTLKKLQRLLKLDPNCSSFLGGNGTDPQTELSGIIDNHLYGQTEIPPTSNGPGSLTMTNAVSFGYIMGQAITVNTIGAFFNSTYKNMPLTTDRGKIAGGTPAAQGFIMLHELGHLTDSLKPDFNKQKVVDENDKTLEGHCKDLIKALSK